MNIKNLSIVIVIWFSLPACHSPLFADPPLCSIGNIIMKKDIRNGEAGVMFTVTDVYVFGSPGASLIFTFRIDQDTWPSGSTVQQEEHAVPFDPAHWKTAAWFFYPILLLEKKGNPDEPYHGFFSVIDSGTEAVLASKRIAFSIKCISDYAADRRFPLEKHPHIMNAYLDEDLTGNWIGLNPDMLTNGIVGLVRLGLDENGTCSVREETWLLSDTGIIEKKEGKASGLQCEWFIDLPEPGGGPEIPALHIRNSVNENNGVYRYAFFQTGALGCVPIAEESNPLLPFTHRETSGPLLFFPASRWETSWEENRESLAYAIACPSFRFDPDHIPLNAEMAEAYRSFMTAVLME
ncbi:MAG: hypothetical protein JW881_18745 [Spirochaetales bacterium]|nr:hypothetical protein [Spirochaetales bacterium]